MDTQPLWRRAATHTLHASIILKAELEGELQDQTGLLLADNEALINLAAADQPLRMSDIAERLILSRGGTTKVIDRLEEMGLVQRHPHSADRRATLVEITPAGRHAMRQARSVIDAALEQMWAAHITDAEATVLIEVMDRVVHAHHGPADSSPNG